MFSHWDGNRHKVYMKERGWCAECMAVGREAGTVTHKEAKMPPGSRTMRGFQRRGGRVRCARSIYAAIDARMRGMSAGRAGARRHLR